MHEAVPARINQKEVIFMKSFISLFRDSYAELKKTSALTVTGMLMAVSIILRNLAINITADLRITFAFLGIMAIAALYGPSVSVLSSIGVDLIGYFMDGYKARDYNFGLLAVKIIAGVIYGVMLYRKATGKKSELIVRACISRIIVALFCNIVLNSSVLYFCYTNPDFPFMPHSEWTAFWVWFTPRLIKNIAIIPVEILLISLMLPAVSEAYSRVFRKRSA